MNVFRNYVPNKYITIDDKHPVSMNEIIKSKIKTKNLLFKQYIQNGRFESDFVLLETLITEINELISLWKSCEKTRESATASKNILVNSLNLLQFKNKKTIKLKKPNNSTSFDRQYFCHWYRNEDKHFQYIFCWAMYTLKKQQRTSSKPNVFNTIYTKFYKFQRRLNPQDYKSTKSTQGVQSWWHFHYDKNLW